MGLRKRTLNILALILVLQELGIRETLQLPSTSSDSSLSTLPLPSPLQAPSVIGYLLLWLTDVRKIFNFHIAQKDRKTNWPFANAVVLAKFTILMRMKIFLMLIGVSSIQSVAAIRYHQHWKNHKKFPYCWDRKNIFHLNTASKMSQSIQDFRAIARRICTDFLLIV